MLHQPDHPERLTMTTTRATTTTTPVDPATPLPFFVYHKAYGTLTRTNA